MSFSMGIKKIFYVLLEIICAICIGWITNLHFYPKENFFALTNWRFFICYLVFVMQILARYTQMKEAYSVNSYREKLKVSNKEAKYYKDLYLKFRINTQAAIDGMLEYVGKNKLGFDKQEKKTDRITVYGLNSSETEFFAVSRYSEKVSYKKIDSSKTYDKRSGCISIGFEQGEYIEDKNFPDYEKQPEKYIKYTCDKYNYTREEVEKFSMHARYYAVKRIKRNGKNLGVVVIESTVPERFTKRQIKSVLDQLVEDISPMFEDLVRQIENVEIEYKEVA